MAFFDELKGFRDKFKWVKAVVHPLTRAGKSSSKGVSVLDKSNMARTLGCARNEHSIGESEILKKKEFSLINSQYLDLAIESSNLEK